MQLARLVAVCALPLSSFATAFSLNSPDISDRQTLALVHVYNANNCQGGNRSPALGWQDPPSGTRSFALTVFDPDARAGLGWWHWAVYNLPATSRQLAAGAGASNGSLPPGARHAINSFGNLRYDGACPPVGDHPHHYQFTLWALDTASLELAPGTTGPQLLNALAPHLLGSVSLVPTYGRR